MSVLGICVASGIRIQQNVLYLSRRKIIQKLRLCVTGNMFSKHKILEIRCMLCGLSYLETKTIRYILYSHLRKVKFLNETMYISELPIVKMYSRNN